MASHQVNDVEKWNKEQCKAWCRARGVVSSGSRADLQERIKCLLANDDDAPAPLADIDDALEGLTYLPYKEPRAGKPSMAVAETLVEEHDLDEETPILSLVAASLASGNARDVSQQEAPNSLIDPSHGSGEVPSAATTVTSDISTKNSRPLPWIGDASSSILAVDTSSLATIQAEGGSSCWQESCESKPSSLCSAPTGASAQTQQELSDNLPDLSHDGNTAEGTSSWLRKPSKPTPSSHSFKSAICLAGAASPPGQGFQIDLAGQNQLCLRAPTSTEARPPQVVAVIDSWPELRRTNDAHEKPPAWLFDSSLYIDITQRLARKKTEDMLPAWVSNAWKQALRLGEGIGDVALRYVEETPKDVRKAVGELLPYQVEAVRFGISRGGRLLCADEMGLGKTLTALALAHQYREEWPVLVVCPPAVRHQWRAQILHWLGHVIAPDDVQLVLSGKDVPQPSVNFIVVPFSLIREDALQRRADGNSFDVVICDESHYIKEHSAQRTQALLPILQRAKRAVLLSGTPSLNHAAELHSQLQAVLGTQFASFNTFANRYAKKRSVKYGRMWTTKYVGVQREDELGTLVRQIMIRRRKDEVLTQLPNKRRQRVVVPASDVSALKEAQRAFKQDDADLMNADDVRDVFKLLCNAKIKSTQDYVSFLLENLTSKALLFAHHRQMLDAIELTLRSHRVKFIRVDGSTPQSKRPKLIHEFQNDLDTTIALLSITACGEGLHLSAASVVVFCELYWVPGVMEQCEARAHRMGQVSTVDVHYIVVENSVDENAFRLLSSKKEATSMILDGGIEAFDPEAVVNANPVVASKASMEEEAQGLISLRAARLQDREKEKAERAAGKACELEAKRAAEQTRKAERAAERSAELEAKRVAKAEAKAHSRKVREAAVAAKAKPKVSQPKRMSGREAAASAAEEAQDLDEAAVAATAAKKRKRGAAEDEMLPPLLPTKSAETDVAPVRKRPATRI